MSRWPCGRSGLHIARTRRTKIKETRERAAERAQRDELLGPEAPPIAMHRTRPARPAVAEMKGNGMGTTGLTLWYNESDWVVAASPEDAWKVLEEATGLTKKDFDLTTERERTGFWKEYLKPVSMMEHEDQPLSEVPKKTPAEIVSTHGRAYIGSSEW